MPSRVPEPDKCQSTANLLLGYDRTVKTDLFIVMEIWKSRNMVRVMLVKLAHIVGLTHGDWRNGSLG